MVGLDSPRKASGLANKKKFFSPMANSFDHTKQSNGNQQTKGLRVSTPNNIVKVIHKE